MIGIGFLSLGDHKAGAPLCVDGDDFDCMQIIGGESQRPAQESERAADDVSAHSDRRILAERYDHSPIVTERAETLTNGGARLDGDGAHFCVVVDALHRRDVDENAHVRIRNESLEAVPAAGDDEASPVAYSSLYSVDYFVARMRYADVIRTRRESLVEAFIENAEILRIVSFDADGFD